MSGNSRSTSQCMHLQCVSVRVFQPAGCTGQEGMAVLSDEVGIPLWGNICGGPVSELEQHLGEVMSPCWLQALLLACWYEVQFVRFCRHPLPALWVSVLALRSTLVLLWCYSVIIYRTLCKKKSLFLLAVLEFCFVFFFFWWHRSILQRDRFLICKSL